MGTISLQLPVSGQPNSTEDPKVASDFTTIQTVINGNIDTNNISPTAGITFAQVSLGVASRAYRNAALSLAAGWNKVPVDTKSFDPNGAFDVTTNFRYNVPSAGYYQVNGNFLAQLNNSPQNFVIGIYKNGLQVTQGGDISVRGGVSPDNFALQVSDIILCAAADYLELWAYNNGANACPLNVGASFYNYLSVIRVA